MQFSQSQIIPNKNFPLVWRYEYSAGAMGPYNGATGLTVAMGMTVVYTRVVPLKEISHLKCVWKATAYTAAAAAKLAMYTYIDTVLFDESDVNVLAGVMQNAFCHDISLNHAASNATVEFKVAAATATVALYYYKASIDVCRA